MLTILYYIVRKKTAFQLHDKEAKTKLRRENVVVTSLANAHFYFL